MARDGPRAADGRDAEVASSDEHDMPLYDPWDPLTLAEARELFAPLAIPWWITGGVAAEAFHQRPRGHRDLDVAIFRRDLPRLRTALAGRFHVWSAGSGMLRPVTDRFPEPHPESDQLWLREHALAPWRVDVLLDPDDAGRWVFRRDPAVIRALDDATWQQDGIRYLRPEIVLAFKAKRTGPRDEHDFAAIEPRLDEAARSWLAAYLERAHPAHPWRPRLT